VSTTVELFEHQTIRIGEPLRAVDGREVRLSERHFDDLARFNDAHGGRFFTVGHRRISLTEYVGYVEVGDLALEILPKADRARDQYGEAAAWRNGLLEMLGIATGLRLESPSAASQRTGRSSLIELVAARFLDELGVLLHQGLAKGYRDEEQNGPTFRGRLLVAEHLRANLARADRFHVRTQAYDRDVPLNQILGAALNELGGLALSSGCAARAATCRADFPEVTEVAVTVKTFERIRLGRTTMRYQHALILARMLFEQSAPQLRAGKTRVFALLFDMNMLWERYVAALFRRAACPTIEVLTQERHPFWNGAAHRRGVRPDIVVRSRGTGEVLLIADTKWKVLHDGPPADSDLQQMFVYNELLRGPQALLVYPSVGGSECTRGLFSDREHGCGTMHLVPLAGRAWASSKMHAAVASLLNEVVAGTAVD
jgi:5-methylcytosine-specific restriction enzyme subunit McrC